MDAKHLGARALALPLEKHSRLPHRLTGACHAIHDRPRPACRRPAAEESARRGRRLRRTARDHAGGAAGDARARRVVLSDRETTLTEFEDYLRTVNNRDGRPYEEKTISAYAGPGKHLDKWLTSQGIDGDFTVADTALLNRYFREYYLERGQGGTHTLQRNLLQLFNFLQRERDHPSPYTEALNRYAEVKGRPKTLGAEFIDDLLEVTGGGKARDFETARDHAIIRILRSEGIRRSELLGMVMHTLPADIIKNPVFRLVPLKGARAAGEGRLVALAPASARALAVYLRARRHHSLAASDWVWLGTRNRGKLQNTGLRMILVRRAEQAGYMGVTPHLFRHTFSDDWLKSGGSEGDLMRLNGWKSRAMVDRYADDVANQRALEAKRRRGVLTSGSLSPDVSLAGWSAAGRGGRVRDGGQQQAREVIRLTLVGLRVAVQGLRDCLAYRLVGVQEAEEFGDWHVVGGADAADRDRELVSFCQLIRLGPPDADRGRGGEQADRGRARCEAG
jgi:integrase/recombinase XerD